MDILYKPFGFLLQLCYGLTSNYGIAIILFALIVRFAMLPLGIKSQKTQVRMAAVRPKEAVIRKKFATDSKRMNEELQRLYQEEGVNPMGGCLPLLIQLPIIMALFHVINRPLSYILNYSNEKIFQISQALALNIPENQITNQQIQIAEAMRQNTDALSSIPDISLVSFNFLGLNLSLTPSITALTPLVLIPVLSMLANYLSSWISQKLTPQPAAGQPGGMGNMGKTMMLMMPLTSLIFTFQVPAGVGLYWIVSSLFSAGQTVLLARLFPIPKVQDAPPELSRKQQKKQEMQRRAEARRRLEEQDKDTDA